MNAAMIADLTRALVKLEDEDRRQIPGALLSVCVRCGSISIAEGLQSHRDDCPYAVLAKVAG